MSAAAPMTSPVLPSLPADRLTRGLLVPAAAVAVLAVAAPFLGGYASDLVVKVMILAIFALSLELLVGMTGLVSLGHAAFYGIGAYVTVLASGDEGGNLLVL